MEFVAPIFQATDDGSGSAVLRTGAGASLMGLLAQIFGKPKPLPVVIIRNRLGEEIDRVEGVRDLENADLCGRRWAHADLSGLSLDDANCEGVSLFGARLVKTSF